MKVSKNAGKYSSENYIHWNLLGYENKIAKVLEISIITVSNEPVSQIFCLFVSLHVSLFVFHFVCFYVPLFLKNDGMIFSDTL